VIAFRPLGDDELPLLHEWLQRPHVRRWWYDAAETLEGTREQYLPALEGRDPSDLYLILLDEEPVGMIQTYLVADHPDYAALTGVGAGVAGVDLLIGEEALTGRGLGAEVIRVFVRDIVFGRPGVHACIATVEAGNLASRRAFEKAGFHEVRALVEDGRPSRLLRLERPAGRA